MKAELKGGNLVDILSGPEFSEGVDLLAGRVTDVRKALEAMDAPPMMERVAVTINCDASGNIGGGTLSTTSPVPVFRCPEGMTARIVRLSVADSSHTPAAPLAAGWIAFYVDSVLPPNLAVATPPLGSTSVLPAVYTDGTHSATMLRNGQSLVVVANGLGANNVVGIGLGVWLYPTAGRPE